MADSDGWFGGLFARVDTTGRFREDFTEWDFDARDIFGFKIAEICAYEAAKEGCGDIIGVSFFLSVLEMRSCLSWGLEDLPIIKQ